MKKYLEETQVIAFINPDIQKLSHELSKNCTTDEEIAKNCFIYVRDNIHHSGDFKNKNHLFHLFVDEKYHKKGIAKKLWQYVKEHFDISNMSVNASLFSIKTYESFGFKISGEQSEYLGLKYQPMSYI